MSREAKTDVLNKYADPEHIHEYADEEWCLWCDRPRHDCACRLDPNGIPEGHWSKI